MKILHFQYEMQLEFDQDVQDHHFRFQCLPLEDSVQRDLGTVCSVAPCGHLTEVADGFGNRGCFGEATGPHRGLTVDCRGRVQVDFSRRTPVRAHPVFKVPTGLTRPEANIREFYEQTVSAYVQSGGNPAALDILLVQFLADRLRERVIYESGVTDVKTTAAQALAFGKGVCQDYAHLMVSLCRLAGIPARYVSGAMAGEGATHAWAEAWTGGFWTGVDAANGCLADEGYIRFACGRDFADCTVDKGCFKGAAAQRQRIYVKVEERS